LAKTERKWGLLEQGVVLYSFSSATKLTNVIKMTQLEIWPKDKLSGVD